MKNRYALLSLVFLATNVQADNLYKDHPVTLNGYDVPNETSVSYSGQSARHVLHDSIKKLAGKGDGGNNSQELEDLMLEYFHGSDADLDIIAPKTKGDFIVKQSKINEISKGKNLSGKTYKGIVSGWPGHMSGVEVIEFMIHKAARTKGGVDPVTGYIL